VVLPEPEPRRIPAQASLIVLPVTVLLLPADGGHVSSVWMPSWLLPQIMFDLAEFPSLQTVLRF
jgi:hypothetical protein